MRDEKLFNCCTNCEAPDWSQYDALEAHPVAEFDDGYGGKVCEICDDKDATFYSVYAHLKEGMVDCITDCPDKESARAAIAKISELSGLPITYSV